MIIHLRPNIKTAWVEKPDVGDGSKDNPVYWNYAGATQSGYYYTDLPSTGGEYEQSVDAWVYGKFEQGQSYDFRAVAMEWGLEVKVYDAENNQVASGHFDDMEYKFVLDFEPETTGIYYFNITCFYVMGEPKIGVNPAPVAITPYIERSKGKAETKGFNEQGRAILYSSIRAADLRQKTMVYAAGEHIPTGAGYENSNTFKPLEFLGKLPIKVFSVYGKRYAYVLEDGSLWTFGENRNGHGNNDEEIFMPRQITGEWQDVSVGQEYTIATDKDGSVFGWGRDYQYSLMGKGDKSKPELLFSTKAKKIQASWYFNAVLTEDNDLYVWGSGGGGQLGLGDTTNRKDATKHDGKYKDFALGQSTLFAINMAGELFSAGCNGHGGLGQGDTNNKTLLTQVGTATDWESISAGEDHSIALKTDKTVLGAGKGYHIGFADYDNRTVFTEIPFTQGTVNSIYASMWSTIIGTTDGKFYGTFGDEIFPTGSFAEATGINKPYKVVGNKYFNGAYILGRP